MEDGINVKDKKIKIWRETMGKDMYSVIEEMIKKSDDLYPWCAAWGATSPRGIAYTWYQAI